MKPKTVFFEQFFPADYENVIDNQVIEFQIRRNGNYVWKVTEKQHWIVLDRMETKIRGEGISPNLKDAKESGKIVFLKTIARYV